MAGEHWILELNYAATRVSNGTKDQLYVFDVDVMDWKTKLPDFKITENVLCILNRRVYCCGRQYDIVHSLQEAFKTT